MDKIIIVHKISPKYDSTKLINPTFDDLVDVFEDRMKGWMLDWAEYLNKQEHAGFAALHIGISYFESITIFIKGDDSRYKSEVFFKLAIKEVFSGQFGTQDEDIVEQIAVIMYKQGRCGFYHSGLAKKEIGLRDGNLFTIEMKNKKVESVWLDRHKFIEAIKKHLDNYVRRLRSTAETQLRENFLKAWDIFHADSIV